MSRAPSITYSATSLIAFSEAPNSSHFSLADSGFEWLGFQSWVVAFHVLGVHRLPLGCTVGP